VRLIAQHAKANGASRGAEVQCEVLHAIGLFGIGAATRAARVAAVPQDYFKTLGVHPVCKNNHIATTENPLTQQGDNRVCECVLGRGGWSLID
jgi:hypothetical protein